MKNKRLFLFCLMLVLIFGLLITGCADEAEPVPDEPADDDGEAVVDDEDYPGVPADLMAAVREEGSTLNVYNWSFYIDPGRVEKFEELYDIEVTYDLYESNEEMKSKIMAGRSGYDVVFPTHYTITEMIELGLVQPLNHDWIPNSAGLMDIWKDPDYDPGNAHSMGYMWGTTGYAYNKEQIGDDPRLGSWELMFEGEEYAGRMTMLEEYAAPTAAALWFLGYSSNTEDPDQLEEARQVLLGQKPYVAAYMSGPVREQLIAGDIWLAQFWSGDTLWVMDENPDIGYIVPVEGAHLWIDAMCIAHDAPNPAAAHLFINYLLEPEVQAAVVEYVQFPSAVEGAKDYLGPEYLENAAIYPDDEILTRCQLSKTFTGEARDIRESIFEELRY